MGTKHLARRSVVDGRVPSAPRHSPPGTEATMIRDRLPGTWRLVAWEIRHSDGSISRPYGEKPVGQIIYDPHGRMSVAVMRRDRAKFAVPDKFQGKAEEVKSAFDGFECYFGAYYVNEAEKTVTHRVEGSLYPNLTGAGLTRFAEISDNTLILRTPPLRYGGSTVVATLVWEREPPV
jgi:hypothetical protein